jgi:hypothetical protein
MKTTTVTCRIRLDQAVELEKREEFNVSQFLRDKLDEEFGSNDFIAAKEKELQEQLEKIKSIKKQTQTKEKESSTEKEKFFRDARAKIRENPNFLLGQWEKYKNLFEKISLEKFKEMIK